MDSLQTRLGDWVSNLTNTESDGTRWCLNIYQQHLGRPLFEMYMGIAQIALQRPAPSVKCGKKVPQTILASLYPPRPPSSFTGNGHIVSPKSVTDYDENRHLGDYVDS